MAFMLRVCTLWSGGTNLLDSGSAIYETYECADGRFVSIAPIELKFRKVLFELLGLPDTNDRQRAIF